MLLEGRQHRKATAETTHPERQHSQSLRAAKPLKSNTNRFKERSTMKTARLLRERKVHLKIDALTQPLNLRLMLRENRCRCDTEVIISS